MNILRQILCLKIITIIVLATFFISTMSIREAQARHGVSCPCPLLQTFLLQIKLAKAFGVFDRDALVCHDEPDQTSLAQGTACSYGVIAQRLDVGRRITLTCAATTNACPFDLSYALAPLTEDELAACRKKILLAAWLLGIPCDAT